jgi:hypothetical protein
LPDLEPLQPPKPPARQPGGDGPVELWRRANAPTKGTALGILLLLIVVGSFLAGRLTAPDGAAGSGGDGSSGGTTQRAAPVDLAEARRQDATAKDVARTVVTFVESCAALAASPDYSRCRTAAELNVGSTLPVVDGRDPGRGQVAVVASRDAYRVVSVTASGNRFEAAKAAGGETARSCSDAGARNAGCVGGVW